MIIKTGEIPNNLYIFGAKDENNFYCFKGEDRQKAYLFNIEDGSAQEVINVTSPDQYIKTIATNDKWLIWVEDGQKNEGGKSTEANWASYAKNLNTGKIIIVDQYNDQIDPGSKAFYQQVEPLEFSIYGDYVVYDNYCLIENGLTAQAIILFDLAKKEKKIIDLNKDYADNFYSHPKIAANYITWSQSQLDPAAYSEKGTSYLYNIQEKKKMKIADSDEILWPNICGDYIIARCKPNGQNENSSLVLYKINANDTWKTVVSSGNSFYQGYPHLETGMTMMSQKYLMWRDNINHQVIVYDYIDDKYFEIATISNDRNQEENFTESVTPAGIFNNVVFWFETKNNLKNPQDQKTTSEQYVRLN